MCWALYIGTKRKLPIIDWNKDAPAFHATHLEEYELGVKTRFSMPDILSLGSVQGCGCGFRYALISGEEWFAIELADDEEKAAKRKDHDDLFRYITANVDHGFVEIYACWNGDVLDHINSVEEISVQAILDENFYFKEGWFYKVWI